MPPTTLVRRVRLAIIGGPAGLTAALYCARASLKPLVITGVPAGGQLMLTTDVENYPGFPEGIQGPDLMERFRHQAARFGAEFAEANVTKVNFRTRPFQIEIGLLGKVEADAVIIATGANARWLGLPNEQRLRGYGVSACATCDGFFFKGKEVALVGGGDSAMEEALFLTKFATGVTIIHRRAEFRASRIMQDRAHANPKISFLLETEVIDVLGTKQVEGIRVRHRGTRKERDLPVGGFFLAIGHDPATEAFRGEVELDEKGYVVTHDITFTSVPGVFAAGDVHDHRYRQAVSAAGLGCMAALDVEKYLAEHGLAQPAIAKPSQPEGSAQTA